MKQLQLSEMGKDRLQVLYYNRLQLYQDLRQKIKVLTDSRVELVKEYKRNVAEIDNEIRLQEDKNGKEKHKPSKRRKTKISKTV